MGNTTPKLLYPWENDTASIVQEAGWAPGPVWTGAENVVPWDLIEAVVSHYTDCDFPAHLRLLGTIYQVELVSTW